MALRFLSILGLTLLILSCKQTEEKTVTETEEIPVTEKISETDISKMNYTEYVLDPKTEATIEEWLKYHEFDAVVENVKQGDLSYFHDNDRNNIIRNFFIALKKAIPETVNSSAVLARILVLETKTWKLESLSNLSTTTEDELNQTIKEFLIAFSNLNLQMNKKLEKDSQNIEKP
tara:strand:+ start:67833 stop:68357 length:525 start_codon:yes stop_codon:yes gene_type:complete